MWVVTEFASLAYLLEKPMTEKFWVVWRRDGGSPPGKKHESRIAAIEEAARLAQQTNADYFVLEVIGIVAPQVIPVNFVELP